MHADVRVRPVDTSNRDAVLALRAHPWQRRWVGPVADLLADAEVCDGCEPMAIVESSTVVGYCRIERCAAAVIGRHCAYPELRRALGLRAFFLDRRHQGRGLGLRAVHALCADLARRHQNRGNLVLTVHERNDAAVGCYLRAGFRKTGTLYHGGGAGPQQLMRRRLTTIHTHP